MKSGGRKMKNRGRKSGEKGGKRGNVRGSKKNRKEIFKKKGEKKLSGKQEFCFNRYRNKHRVEEELKKKQMLEEKLDQQYESSDSDVPDPIQQLLSTFNSSERTSNKSKAVESSDESEEDMEVIENENVDEEGDSASENSLNLDGEMSADDDAESVIDETEELNRLEVSNSSHHSDDIEFENSISENEAENINEYDEELIQAGQQVNGDEENIEGEEAIEEKEVDEETEKDDKETDSEDPFTQHLRDDLHDSLLQSVSKKPPNIETSTLTWATLGRIIVQIPKTNQSCEIKETKQKFSILEEKTYAQPGKIPLKIGNVDWDKLCIKKQIQPNLVAANKINLFKRDFELTDKMTPKQKELFSIINNYQDLYYPERSVLNGEEIRYAYCLHALNHILKTRTKILHHNAKLGKKIDVPDEFRDQGLVRPKVIIVVPFKDSAYRIVKMLIEILVPGDGSQVGNKNRFEEDFTGGELIMPKRNPKPEDYESTFAGNTEDTFRIGLSLTKKTLKLYSDFYSSDIIIASPLGLRVVVGAEGEEERDFDFLASVELLIMDQTEIFLMQNWDHLLHVLDHFHMQPKQTHGTDFSRLRSWTVNGWTKYYRQTLIFSSICLPEINSLFNKKCFNYAGKIRIHNQIEAGSIRQVAVQVPQVFRRIEAKDPISAIEARFEYLIKEIIPQYKDSIMAHTMIYVPSYFDFVRIRNYFKKEDVSFVQICEYSKDAKIARARDMFFHTEAHFLLYSERFHFFRRMRIKGIRHIVFYQPPIFPHFYSEVCNLMQEANQNKYGGSESNMTVTVLYTKYDLQQISAIVSTERTSKMCQSERNVHMFMTGE